MHDLLEMQSTCQRKCCRAGSVGFSSLSVESIETNINVKQQRPSTREAAVEEGAVAYRVLTTHFKSPFEIAWAASDAAIMSNVMQIMVGQDELVKAGLTDLPRPMDAQKVTSREKLRAIHRNFARGDHLLPIIVDGIDANPTTGSGTGQ
jgi:hypothetical protein